MIIGKGLKEGLRLIFGTYSATGLSSKEEDVIFSRGCNFDPIVTKRSTQEGLVKVKTDSEDEPNRSHRSDKAPK